MKQFFNLKSNFYFLQKLVFAIFCFALGFLLGSGILKAKASDSDYTQYYYSNNLNYCDGFDFSENLKDLEEELKKTGYYYSLVLTYRLPPNNDICYDALSVNIFNEKPVISNFTFSNNKIFYNSNHRNLLFMNVPNKEYMNVAIDRVKNLSSNITFGTSSNDIPLIARYSTSNYVLYSSNFDIYNKSNDSLNFYNETTSEIVTVSPNGIIPKLKEEMISKKIYTENYNLSTKDIKQIEYTFDFSNVLNENNMFSHEFNFSTSLNLENATFDIFDYPYLQYTKDNVTYELPLNAKTDETGNQLMYFDTQINSFQDIQDLKFIVPTEKLMNVEADMFIHFDSNLPFTRKIYTKEEELPPLQFYNVYNVNNIDHIEVEFDLNSVPPDSIIPTEKDYFKFKMKYDIKITSDNRGHNLINDKTLDIPRIEYMKVLSDGIIDTSTYGLSNNRLNQYNMYFGKEEYTNTYLANYDYNRTLKLIINCRDIDDVFLNLKLQSNLKYKIKIFYREDIEDYRKYYQTIDITGKYAVVFIPKIRLNDGENSVSSYFISNGSFRVEERDTYKKEFTLYKTPIKVLGDNQYYYFYGLPGELHKNDSLYYKNLNYPGLEMATIQYDSRYFVVSICENDYMCQTITNPNTGETITPNTSPSDGEWTIDRVFKVVDEFLAQVRSTSDYFDECFNAFWEKIPVFLQNMIIFLYIMLHIIVFIRIGGWSND